MFLSRIKVGQRLLIGFGTSILLLIAMALVSWFSMSKTISDTVDLLDHRLKNERLASEWKSIVETNVQRTLASVRSTDSATQKFFDDGILIASKKGEEDQKLLEQNLKDAQARTFFFEALEKRKVFQAMRRKALASKSEGDVEKSQRIVDQELMPAAEAYLASVNLLIERQKKVIDEVGNGVEHRSVEANITVATLTLLSIALSVTLGWLITRSLLRQLGGEPSYAAEITDRIAAGDLTVTINLQPGDKASLLFSIATMRDQLAEIVTEVRSGTDSMAVAANEIADGNMDLSSRTEQQASSLEETASSMEELTTTVKKNGDYARQVSQMAMDATQVAVQGGNVVADAVTMMNSIDESSRKIVDIISVIDAIAFQTNILALNAAVEAARAGEQGRGFAVVATEVRNLAHRSASAAKDVKTLIGDSVKKIADGSALVREVGVTMGEIVSSAKGVGQIMADIGSASHEQEVGIEQVNQAITEMDSVTQQNASLVEEAAAAAESLRGQASRLTQAVSVFKLNAVIEPGLSMKRLMIGFDPSRDADGHRATTLLPYASRRNPGLRLLAPSDVTS